jgi:hypothetical protein
LSAFRGSNGFGPEPLRLPDIATYCEKIGYNDPDDFFFFAEVMRACDDVYLTQKYKEAESASKHPKGGGSRSAKSLIR